MEEWKVVENYPNYLVSTLGRIWNIKMNREQTTHWNSSNKKHRYLVVSITNEEGRKTKRVHRLVARAFVERPEHLKDVPFEDLEVDHINGDRENNTSENLKWATRLENQTNPITIERMIDAQCESKGMNVLQYTKDGFFIAEFNSLREAERKTGIKNNHISRVCNGLAHTAGGYIWSFNKA